MENEAAGILPERHPLRWNRRNELKGRHLYCSAKWEQHYKDLSGGKIHGSDDPFEQTRPELPPKFLDLDLDAEPGAERYMSLTERLSRVYDVFFHFRSIASGEFQPTRYPPVHREPLPLPIYYGRDGRWHLCQGHPPDWHGPSDEWRRRATEIWATLPANDSDIFARKAEPSANPKLGHLAEQLKPLLAWRRARESLSLDSTNWLQADNDNVFDGEQSSPKVATNLERRIRPGSSDAELVSYINKVGACCLFKHAKLGGGGDWETIPTDIDRTNAVGKRKKIGSVSFVLRGPIKRAGRLHLASGDTQSEGVRVEAGTILYQPDSFRELLGPEPDPAEKARSLSYWTSLYGSGGKELEPVRFRKRGKMRRKVLITPEEQKALLAGPLPPTTYCKPGLPCGHDDIGAQFVGGWMSASKGKSGIERWEDVSDELARRGEFDRWAKALGPEMEKVMHLGLLAANFREIGEAFGKAGKNAERYGKDILIAANNNLKKVMAA